MHLGYNWLLTMYSRRDFTRITLASLPLSAAVGNGKPNSRIAGVQLGAQSYSFRTMPLDDAIKAMADIGLSECELWQGHVEPQQGRGEAAREELRKWRLETSMDHFRDVGKKFRTAGINLYAYNYSFRDDFTDAEMNRGFEMAKALGAKVITASSTVTASKRVAGYAEDNRMMVGMHGHDNVKDANEFATPESFAAAMNESKWIGVNLDIGHFTAADYDPVDYLEKHHDRIVTLHIKDRKKNHGANLAFGEGDTNIKGVLQVLKTKKYKIPANIEYEYKGAADSTTEVRKCYEFCKQALA
jgi:sugar phosphate isomerase/epimerase